MNLAALPFPRSYWVAERALLAGCYPGDPDEGIARQKLQGLVDAGVTLMLSLMQLHETDCTGRPFRDYRPGMEALAAAAGRKLAFARFGIPDMGVPAPSLMTEILDAVDRVISGGGCVYVHCWGGKGRTGTVVGCWLMRHAKAEPPAVLPLLAQLTRYNRAAFSEIPQTDAQRAFVQRWLAGQ